MDFFEEFSGIRKYVVRLPEDIITFLNEINDLLKQIKLGKDVVIEWLQ